MPDNREMTTAYISTFIDECVYKNMVVQGTKKKKKSITPIKVLSHIISFSKI